MIATLRKLLLPALLGLALLAVLTVVASVVVLYREASAVHPWLGAGVLVLAGVGATLLVVWPVATVLALPRGLSRPDPQDERAWRRYVRRYAARLTRNPRLREGWDGWADLERAVAGDPEADELTRQIDAALEHLDGLARAHIRRQAAIVFASTAVSQSGRLDTVLVLGAQLRLVREVAEIYLQRPSAAELLRLYANVGASAFLAGELEDSQILAVLGAPVGAAVTSLVPVGGTDPLVSLLVTSLLDGSANGFLTLRVGAVARRYCALRPQPSRRAVAASASLEAAGLLASVVSDGAARVAQATRRLVVESAVEGAGRAARSLAGAGTGVGGRLVDMIDRAGRELGRRAERPSRKVLEQALRFWEGVAGRAAERADDTTGAS